MKLGSFGTPGSFWKRAKFFGAPLENDQSDPKFRGSIFSGFVPDMFGVYMVPPDNPPLAAAMSIH